MTTRVIDNIFYAEQLVRFSHCDPAGIVFYPQYFIMFNGLVEDWFNEGLGVDYANFITQHRLGFPIVNLNCDFISPSKIGEKITLGLKLEHLGKSSLKLDITCSYKGTDRVRAAMVLVAMDLDQAKGTPIPDDLRSLMSGFQNGKFDINQYHI